MIQREKNKEAWICGAEQVQPHMEEGPLGVDTELARMFAESIGEQWLLITAEALVAFCHIRRAGRRDA